LLVTVIGGGAAGLISGVIAGWNGARVTIIERKGKLGKKLLASSNGRGNFSNLETDENHYFSNNLDFVKKVLQISGVAQTLSIFEEIGIIAKEKGTKLFPYTERSKDIVDNFKYEIAKHNINVVLNFQVEEIIKKENKFLIKCQNKSFESDKVIVATGGKSSPQYGSNGNIFETLKKLGHSIIELKPGLVPLKVIHYFTEEISGSKLEGNVYLTDQKGEILSKVYKGEVLFKKGGILSGIPILELSNYIHPLIENGKDIFIKLIAFPSYSEKDIYDLLTKKIKFRPEKPLRLLLLSLIDQRLIPYFFKRMGIENLDQPVGYLTTKDIEILADKLKYWDFQVKDTCDWKDSQVSLGGINTNEIDPYTLESKIIPGLFFAGEVIDVAGESGGFNLQWAWSSGYLAGISSTT